MLLVRLSLGGYRLNTDLKQGQDLPGTPRTRSASGIVPRAWCHPNCDYSFRPETSPERTPDWTMHPTFLDSLRFQRAYAVGEPRAVQSRLDAYDALR